MDWTMRELKSRGVPDFGELLCSLQRHQLLLFTAASPVTTPAKQFFLTGIWRQADTGQAVSLVDAPAMQNRYPLYLPVSSTAGCSSNA
jgi:hypothetical protein